MSITVEQFAGTDINTATFTPYLESPDAPYLQSIEPVLASPLDRPPLYVRGRTQARTVVVHVQIISGDFLTGWEDLAEAFRPGKRGPLVVDFDGTRRALDCIAMRVLPHDGSPNLFTAVLLAPNPYWRNEDVQRASQSVTVSPTTWSLSNGGNKADDEPVVRLQPYTFRAAADGQRYKAEIIIANRQPRPFTNYAIEVTENWDHAAEVSASRSQADGDDVQLLLNFVPIHRWDGENAATDWNSATTNVWGNFDLSPMKTAVLFANITATDPLNGEDLEVRPGGTKGWPKQGAILINDECIHYYGTTTKNANGREAFLNVTRGARNTTAGSHTAGDTLYWVEHRVQLVWGDTGAGAVTEDAKTKPLLDLSSATLTNLRHEWVNFADPDNPGRSMAWSRRLRSDDDQAGRILAPQAATGVDADMSWEYQKAGPYAAAPNFNTWYRDLPSGTGASGGNVVSLTRTVNDTLALLARGFDADGQEVELEDYNGPLTSGSDSIAEPDDPVYRIELMARSQVAMRTPEIGTAGGQSFTNTLITDANAYMQQFVAPGSGTIKQILIDFSDITGWAGGRQINLIVYPDNGSDAPDSNGLISAVAVDPGANGAQRVSFTVNLAVAEDQKYWIALSVSDATLTPTWKFWRHNWAGGKARSTGSNVLTIARSFYLISSDMEYYDTEHAKADDSDVVTVDGVTVHLATAGVPYVAMKAREDAYMLDGTLCNLTTGQKLAFATLCSIADIVEVDVRERSLRNLAEGPFALTMSGNEATDEQRSQENTDLTKFLDGLNPVGWWRLGEASGAALDSSGNGNDGAVTIGAGSRNAAALESGGDGCIDFDGADTAVVVTQEAAINDLFGGGGSVFCMFNADGPGEGTIWAVVNKAAPPGWSFDIRDGGGGLGEIHFYNYWSGSTPEWKTGAVITYGRTYSLVLTYNTDAAANDPTLYLYDHTTGALSTLTVGSGLTELTAPSGTVTAETVDLKIGNNAASGSQSFDGRIDEVALFGSTLTAAQAALLCYASSLTNTSPQGMTGLWTGARVRIAVHDLFSEEQGSVFARLRTGFKSDTVLANRAYVMLWGDDANNRLELSYIASATEDWNFERASGGNAQQANVADTFEEGTDVSVGAGWDRTEVHLSIDGAAATDTAGTVYVPALTAEQADLGSGGTITASAEMFGDFRWVAFFKGTLTDADYAALHAYGNNVPTFTDLERDLSTGALPTAIWHGGLKRFFRAGEPRGLSVVQTVTPSDKQGWLRIDPGANALSYEEDGVLGVQVETATHGRWL